MLGHVERSYAGELIDVRNKWAHEKPFTSDDVYRALDTMQRLLLSVSEGNQAEAVGQIKADLQRQVFAEQARQKTRYQQLNLEGMPQSGLKPWRKSSHPMKTWPAESTCKRSLPPIWPRCIGARVRTSIETARVLSPHLYHGGFAQIALGGHFNASGKLGAIPLSNFRRIWRGENTLNVGAVPPLQWDGNEQP